MLVPWKPNSEQPTTSPCGLVLAKQEAFEAATCGTLLGARRITDGLRFPDASWFVVAAVAQPV